MRAKGPIRVLVLLLAVSLLPAAAVLATHGPTVEDVVAAVEGLGMGCESLATEVDCYGPPSAINPLTVIKPASGPLSQVVTRVNTHTNGTHELLPENRTWFIAIHEVGCLDPGAIGKFIDALTTQFGESETGGTYGPSVVGECSMVGSLIYNNFDLRQPYWYWEVTSNTRPSAFPTPTPTPNPPAPTPTPTPKPPAPTPKPTAKPTTTPTARPTATLNAAATATATASASSSESTSSSATATATPTASPSAEQTVAGITFTPEPSSAPQAPAGGGDDWAGSVPSAGEVSTDAATLAGSGLAALLLLLAMGFIGELFNNTFETNYDRILAGWQKSWLGRLGGALSGLWRGGK